MVLYPVLNLSRGNVPYELGKGYRVTRALPALFHAAIIAQSRRGRMSRSRPRDFKLTHSRPSRKVLCGSPELALSLPKGRPLIGHSRAD